MRKRIYFGKFDQWLAEKIEEDSWTSISLGIIWLLISYPTMYYLPQIAFYVNGAVIPAQHHYGWTMKWFGFLCQMMVFLMALKIIRLLRNKKTRARAREIKLQADHLMEIEILERKQSKETK